MNNDLCIVTGGAGFIGCAASGALADHFARVVAIDTLNSQIHKTPVRPSALDARVEFVRGSVCDASLWARVLEGVPSGFSVLHLAAETGTAQSLGHSTLHTMTNVVGTSAMLDAFTQSGKLPGQILLTSSRAVYGEGIWRREDGTEFYPGQRGDDMLRAGVWDFPGARHVPFRAGRTHPMPVSVYGATKLCQENLISVWARAMDTTWKIVRLQNVYGPGQSLINPYTGIVSLFVRLAKAGESIPLYEDGAIIRDFILIDDVARAIVRDLCSDSGANAVFDIGTGLQTTIADVARFIARRYGAPEPRVCGKFRNGDVRHASCDAEPAWEKLGFRAEYGLEEGLNRLCAWIDDSIDRA